MYKNLNTAALGITGRQSELIELALTYGFRGLDLDMADIIKRARTRGPGDRSPLCHQCRCAGGRIPAAHRLAVADSPLSVWPGRAAGDRTRPPRPWRERLHGHGPALSAMTCRITRTSRLHRRRFAEIGDALGRSRHPAGTRVSGRRRSSGRSRGIPFIHQAETLLTLIKTAGSPHVGLTLDTWSWWWAAARSISCGRFPPQQIVAARFADFAPRSDLSQLTDQDRYLPGDGGSVDGAAILRCAGRTRFAGPVTLYPHPSRFRGMTRDAIMQQANARFDALYRAAGISRSGNLEPLPSEPDPA